MRMILTAGLLCAALLLAVVNTVHAQSLADPLADTVTPIVVPSE